MRRVFAGIAVVAGLGILAWIGFFAFVMLRPVWEDHAHRVPFDGAKWKARSMDEDTEWPTRLRMVDSLMAGRILDGLPRDDVERLLGPPDVSVERQIAYVLGPQRGLMRIDSETLVILLDLSGKVAGYNVATD